ncbi:uncharacterized protein LOC112153721 [Oryzias melastigma]|uniref:uncharacterized protein LOC112153721 n=1 Tax=Oryzias melastigma TaxID=30732 RepID=UPI000CF7E039|nr:uncharacterized protein LOC112153721 [Oryzias melastigma]
MAPQVFLRVGLFALFFAASFESAIKDAKSTGQHSSGSHATPNYVPYQRIAPEYSAPVQYSTSRLMSQPMQFVTGPSLSQGVVQATPAFSGMSSAVPQGLLSSGSVYSVPVEGAGGSLQTGAPQAGLPESSWLVAPQSFEEASTNAQAQSNSELLPQPPLPPAGPVLQSGETSNVVREAELGNYQQQMEEFGYPGQPGASEPGFTRLPVPNIVLPGYWGNPYPGFDYRLLYGLYPPGTYSTFSQSHERGKDYYKDVHYLKEHESEEDEGPQQQKVFPGPPQYSTGQQVASRVRR